MSEENVEIVSALQPDPSVDLVELFRDDRAWSNIVDALGAIFHPELETGFVGRGYDTRNHGVEGFRRTWLEWLEPWESYRADISKLVDRDDRVLVLTDDYGRRRGMTAEVKLLGAAVWTLRAEQIVSAFFYTDRDRALADVGLRAQEPPDSP